MKKTLLSLFLFVIGLATAFAGDVVFDFTNPTTLTPAVAPSTTASSGVEISDKVFTNGSVSLSFTLQTGAHATMLWTNSDAKKLAKELRTYKNSSIVIKATAPITKVALTGGKIKTISVTEGTFAEGTWTGNANTVTLNATGTLNVETITVTCGEGGEVTPDPEPQPEPAQKGEVFSAPFSADMSGFTIDNKVTVTEIPNVWVLDTKYGCMKATGYNGKAKVSYATESWLVSPVIDLSQSTENELAFDNVGNFFKEGITAACSAKIMVEGGQWEDLALVGMPEKNAWTPWVTTTADLKAYDGKKVQIALVYTSTDQIAGTWEVKNFKVLGAGAEIPVEVAVPTFVTETTAFRELINVEMKAAEGLQIHYTTDGTPATAESELYANPIALISTATINAVAVDAQGNVSENVKKTYNLVEAPVAPEGAVVFDFFMNEWNLPVSDNSKSVAIDEIKKDGVTITLMPPTSKPGSTYTVDNRLWYDSKNGIQLRVYKGAVLKFEVPAGKKIQKVTFDAPKFDISSGIGEFVGTAWNGPSFGNILAFNVNSTSNINNIIIEYVAEETSIEGVEAEQNVEKVIFSIDGRRLQAPVQGINIINGKKVIVK